MIERDLAALLVADPAAFARHHLMSLGFPAAPLVPSNGWSNRVWLAPYHVVRIGSGRFRDAFAHEAAVLELLPPDVPHAPVLAYGRIGGHEWLIQDRVHGRPLAQVWPHLDSAQRQTAMAQMGEILRALHAISLPAGFTNPWLDDALALGGQPRDAYHAPPERYATLLAAVAAAPGADVVLLAEVGAFIAERLDAFARDTPVLVHSDIHFANLLWDDGGLTGLLDFEGARPAAPDQELDTLLRYCREPELYRAFGEQAGLERRDLARAPGLLTTAYAELFSHPRLADRLAVYEALWHLVQTLHFPPGPRPPDPWGHLRVLLESGGRWAWL